MRIRTLERFSLRPRFWLCLGLALLATTQLGELVPTPRGVAADQADAPGQRAFVRLREGTLIEDQIGTFQITGDRATFYSADGQHRYVGLENLNLARIVGAVSDDPESREWSVSGTITEYRGSNYLLITRAVLKNKNVARSAQRAVEGELRETLP